MSVGDFTMLPPDDPQTTPADDLAAATAGALALPDSVPAIPDDPPEPFGMSWRFDWEHGQFVKAGQSPVVTFELGALEEWCQMAIHSARFAHAVFCVDDATEILTRGGWRARADLQVGDEVLTLNHVDGASEWQPVLRVNHFDVRDKEMLSIEGRGHSSLTTLAHRWPVIERCGANRRIERRWRTSESLTSEARIITAAPCADTPLERTVPDELVEAVAWFWTEGHVRRGGRSSQASITQSATANPEHVGRIRDALSRLFGPVSPRRMSTGSGALAAPAWREYQNPRGVVTFGLNTRASESLLAVAPGKIVRPEFILCLTREQLQLFVETSLMGDGWRASSGTDLIAQKDGRRLGAIELALILLGRTPHTYSDAWVYHTRRERYAMTTLSASRKTQFGIPTRSRMDRSGTGAQVERRRHTGVVWCPTTRNGTWLARRNGCVYFTGNSDDFGMEEPESMIGEFAQGEALADWERHLVEALLVHDRIASVENITLTWDSRQGVLYIDTLDVITDEGGRLPVVGVALQVGGA